MSTYTRLIIAVFGAGMSRTHMRTCSAETGHGDVEHRCLNANVLRSGPSSEHAELQLHFND